MKIKVAFIDSAVNNNYIQELKNDKITINGNYTISNNGIILCKPEFTDKLSHATVCAKIFCDNVKSDCELFFIHILDQETQKTNLSNLIKALDWCKLNNVNLINLSLGTTLLRDLPALYEEVNDIILHNIIIVAASSNNGKMTFPATFENVIGVKAIQNKYLNNEFLYENEAIDRIDVKCSVKEEKIEFNNTYYSIYSSNSFAVPIITAKICNYMTEGNYSTTIIKNRLQSDSFKTLKKNFWKVQYKKYLTKLKIPVIAIIGDPNIYENKSNKFYFIKDLLRYFAKQEYYGICLSDDFETSFVDCLFNIDNGTEFSNMKLKDVVNFYCNYCDAAFVIVDIKEKSFTKYLRSKDIDVLIYNYPPNKNTKKIFRHTQKFYVSNYKNCTTLYHDIFQLLNDN